jgi:hypothetical protein
MKLPNGELAIVDLRKLRDYCLSKEHLRGRDKARVFSATLGLTADDAQELRVAILEAVLTNPAQPAKADRYGQRFVVDFQFKRGQKTAIVRTCWIIRQDEDFTRLTTCYVLV